MFDDLQKRLSTAFGRFRARGLLTEANIAEGLREVRTALLEADVNYNVVQEFMVQVNQKAVGAQLIKAVRPDQQVVKIVHDAMIELMGPVDTSIRFEKSGPTILMLCGLQGSGKTTTTGKLARLLLSQGRKPLMVAADLQRPAAIEQLKVIGQQLNIPVFSQENSNPVKVCQDALVEANRQGRDTILLDTAGRLHIDDDLMAELQQIEKKVRPHQVYFVCDALTGQDAVASAGAFNEALELNGVILTKLDGDARGGAALSVKQVTGVPIKFVGMGEKLDKLQPFDPERIVGQILGMGDSRRPGRGRACSRLSTRRRASRPAREAGQGEVRPQRLPPADRADEEDGLGQGHHGDDPRHEPDGRDSGRRGRRRRSQANSGHHRQHDQGGAQGPAPDRHLPTSEDRRRGQGRPVRRLRPWSSSSTRWPPSSSRCRR